MTVCGPKLSICCMLLSIWGIIQLGLMGVFFYIHSVALAEDVPAEYDNDPESNLTLQERLDKFHKDVDDGYEQVAVNCWIAAAIYVVILLISIHQVWANNRSTKV